MDIGLNGRKVLVTGGSRGIGRGIVLAFAHAGADVVTCYRSENEAKDSLLRELKETGGDHHMVRADVTEPGDVEQLLAECRTHYGHLDAVVNNAGFVSHVPFADMPEDDWALALDTNLTATFLVSQAALPLLTPGGTIISIGARVASVGIPLHAHYGAAKAGLSGFTRSLGKELGPRGYRVNMVAPGPIETEAPVTPEARERYSRIVPLGRLGRTDEIAAVVLFLASDHASFINGETINVDGGI